MHADSYRHVQPFRAMWLSTLLVAAVVLWVSLRSSDPRAFAAAVLVVLPVHVALLLVFGRLVIALRASQLRWSFGFLGWPHWQLEIGDIVRVERTRSRWLQGAGVRGSAQHRIYNAATGGPGLRLHLRDGRTVFLGTPDDRRLAAFIEARLPR